MKLSKSFLSHEPQLKMSLLKWIQIRNALISWNICKRKFSIKLNNGTNTRMAQRVAHARALRQSGLRLSSLDSSSSIKLLTCQIGIMCIQMEITNGTEHSLNPNGILFSYLLAHWLSTQHMQFSAVEMCIVVQIFLMQGCCVDKKKSSCLQFLFLFAKAFLSLSIFFCQLSVYQVASRKQPMHQIQCRQTATNALIPIRSR